MLWFFSSSYMIKSKCSRQENHYHFCIHKNPSYFHHSFWLCSSGRSFTLTYSFPQICDTIYSRWPDFQCAFKTANADRLVLDCHSERTAMWYPGIELEAITKRFGWTREKMKEKEKTNFWFLRIQGRSAESYDCPPYVLRN